jgi:DNA polymerase I
LFCGCWLLVKCNIPVADNYQPATRDGPFMTAQTLTLIDGSGFIFRAYHALPPLTNPSGVPVGAVVGFINMMLKLIDEQATTNSETHHHIAVVFDAGRSTFRNRIYPQYKANRPPAPDDLVPQFGLVREATRALGLSAIELADVEADDIIATYARIARERGIEVTIISSDKDLMQLIGDGVHMFDAMKNKPIGPAEVQEKFGVLPDRVLDVLSLMGDSSDNVPGVPGIGPKTAAELISQFGTLEELLERAGEIKQQKRRENLQQFADQARLSKQLITLKYDVELPDISTLEVQPVPVPELASFVQHHGFKNLLLKIQQKWGASAVPAAAHAPAEGAALAEPQAIIPHTKLTGEYITIRDGATLTQWVSEARKIGIVAFDTETTSLYAHTAGLVGFSLCSVAGKSAYVPLGHQASTNGESAPAAPSHTLDLFSAPSAPQLAEGQMKLAEAIAIIKPLLADDSVLKIGHNIKFDINVMRQHGCAITPYDDTMLLSYCLHAGEHGHGMDELSERYLGHTTISYDEVTGTGKSRVRFDAVAIDKATAYAAEDTDITLRLWQLFKPQLAGAQLVTLYETIERPLAAVLAAMEWRGIKVDRATLSALSTDFAQRMQDYEREIHALAGREFNLGSPKQLGEILFDELKLEGGKKSAKTGAYSTDNEVLETLAEAGHVLPQKIIEWRQLAKLKSTYTDALAGQADATTSRVHTSFAMAITSTGRLSSSDPNLQNIPIRTVEGKKIREAFIASPGTTLLAADYSQIELRLLAHIANIPSLRTAFMNGDDIHAITASQMFGVPVAEVNSDLRRKAKTINFGIIYGISAHGLAARLGISRSEAGAYIERYFAQYPGIRDYMESRKEQAHKQGYVTTLFGRRCHLPSINDKNAGRRQFSERAAINAPLQGTAADIIKRAMIGIDRALRESATLNENNVRMLLQVHDELVFEVKSELVAEASTLIKRQMEYAASLSIPLTVEIGTGTHWGEAH